MTEQTDASKPDHRKVQENRRILRLFLSAISLVIVGLGAMAIWNEHYFGVSSKHGYKEVVLDGAPAIRMGVTLVLLGLLPMGVWWNTAKGMLTWSVVCALAFCASLTYMLMQSST